MKEFNAVCREHNLIINDTKTNVDIFPFTDGVNKSDLFSYFEKLNSKTSVSKWIREISGFIDYCIDQESSGNKGSIKALFPVVKNTLRAKGLEDKTINKIFSHRNAVTNFNVFEKVLDVSLKDSKLTNGFLDFFESINELGFLSSNASKIVKAYFRNNKNKYINKINYYANNHFNQELYQILLYVVEFDVKSLLLKKELLSLISENIDDFSIILITMIYLRKKNCSMNDLIAAIDKLLTQTHKNYPVGNIRMAEKFWLFRYFFYYLQIRGIIAKKDINSYCKKAKYKSGKKGYETELNWKYIRNNPNQNNIDCFFNELLENEIWLVYCGENDDFSYLPKK